MNCNRKWAFIISAAALWNIADVAQAKSSNSVFSCSFGKKQLEVVNDRGRLIYTFGTVGKPELVVAHSVSSGNVRYHVQLLPHGSNTQLRFQNGEYSYLMYNEWQSPSYSGEGARDDAGLIVFRNAQIISKLKCKAGDGLSNTFDFDAIPDEKAEFLLENLP